MLFGVSCDYLFGRPLITIIYVTMCYVIGLYYYYFYAIDSKEEPHSHCKQTRVAHP